MQRDMDLVRRILLAVETLPPEREDQRLKIEGVADNLVSDHLQLLQEAGYVQAYKMDDEAGWGFFPRRLLWDGHDFLDSIRDQGVWEGTKRKLAAIGGAASLAVVKAVAESVAKAILSRMA